MKHNIGSYDAAGRTVAGLLIILVGHHYDNWWALVGVIPLLTAIVAFCPAYCLFGFDTCAQDEAIPGDHSKV